jgi:hypothetical protein
MQWTKKSAHLVLQMRTRCLMNAWKIPFVTGIRASGQNLKVRSSRRLKHSDFYALLQILHRARKVQDGIVLYVSKLRLFWYNHRFWNSQRIDFTVYPWSFPCKKQR